MYLQFSTHPRYSAEVKEVQRKLNAIKYNVHGNWPVVATDGLYGPETRRAVMGFQVYRNITPATGNAVGDTTMRYINEAYGRVPMIKPAPVDQKPYYDTKGLSEKYPVLQIMDYASDFLSNLDSFIGELTRHITDLGKSNPNALRGAYNSFVTQWNPKMNELKKLFNRNMASNNAISDNSSQAKTRVDTARSFPERQQIMEAQRKISYAKRDLKIYTPKAKKASFDLIAELKKINVLQKIEGFLKTKGLSGEIKVDALKNIKLSGNFKFGAGTCLKVWNFKDLIIDVLSYKEWGTDEWKAKTMKHLYKALDAIIIGYASAVIAELVAGIGIALAAAVGVTVSVGWIAVIVAVVAVIIAVLIGFLLESADVSFSEYAVQGYKYIYECCMSITH